VKRSSYNERDYTFGQLMLTLRTTMGLTQAGLAERLGISRRAVAEWEAGSAYPKVERLTQLIELGVRASTFAAGREEEEIRALWRAASARVRLPRSWASTWLKSSKWCSGARCATPLPARTWSPTASPSSPRHHPPPSPCRWSSASASCSPACRLIAACSCSTTWRRCWRAVISRAATCQTTRATDLVTLLHLLHPLHLLHLLLPATASQAMRHDNAYAGHTDAIWGMESCLGGR